MCMNLCSYMHDPFVRKYGYNSSPGLQLDRPSSPIVFKNLDPWKSVSPSTPIPKQSVFSPLYPPLPPFPSIHWSATCNATHRRLPHSQDPLPFLNPIWFLAWLSIPFLRFHGGRLNRSHRLISHSGKEINPSVFSSMDFPSFFLIVFFKIWSVSRPFTGTRLWRVRTYLGKRSKWNAVGNIRRLSSSSFCLCMLFHDRLSLGTNGVWRHFGHVCWLSPPGRISEY